MTGRGTHAGTDRDTDQGYSLAARTLHWLTALLIFAAFPLGYLANHTAPTDDAAIARAFALFSAHKTTGILALLIGLARIAHTLARPRPAPLAHPAWERFLAALTHHMLSIALVAVPLTGWLAHSASPGLAPILLPVPQALPFVPTDPASAAGLGAIHDVFTKLLAAAVLLHVAGALKHAILDRDATLARMITGARAPTLPRRRGLLAPLVALGLWAAALGFALVFGMVTHLDVVDETREWPLTQADIAITDASGTTLATAQSYSFLLMLAPGGGSGTLDITIPLDAMDGPGIDTVLAALPAPLLSFSGGVTGSATAPVATGTLDLFGQTAPATFTVTITDAGASVQGAASLPGAPDLSLRIDAFARRN